MKPFHLLLLFAAAFAIFSCKHRHYNVIRIQENASSQKDGVFYYLPRTVVTADVVITKTTSIPGPFAEYSEQYIGYMGIQQQGQQYEIENITLSTVSEPDPDQLYFIELDKNQEALFELEENGLLRNVNIQTSVEEKLEMKREKEFRQEAKDEKQKMLTLLNIREKLDTVYQRQIIDSVLVEKRSIERVFIKNTKEESAREAAKKISEIRSQKFSLISFNEDITYEAGAIQTMLAELTKMEEEYFKLFLGYTQSEKLTYRFYFIPDENVKGFQPLFRFSPNKGVSDSLKMIMETIYITQEKDNYTQKVKDFTSAGEKENERKSKDCGLAYRIPGQATFNVIWNNKVLTSAKFPVAQLGSVNRLPAYDLDRVRINMDLGNGSLKLFGMGEEKEKKHRP